MDRQGSVVASESLVLSSRETPELGHVRGNDEEPTHPSVLSCNSGGVNYTVPVSLGVIQLRGTLVTVTTS